MSDGASALEPRIPVQVSANTLTTQEVEVAYLSTFDLGAGYPQLAIPDGIRRLYMDDSLEDLSLRFPPFWTPEKQAQVDEELELAVRRFVGLPSSVAAPVRTTFTGSIALDRAIAAAVLKARSHGAERLSLVTTTPSIDIMRLLLEERSEVEAHFVPSRRDGVIGALDLDALLTTARSLCASGRAVSVLITSPENPTGSSWTLDELRSIASTCAEVGGVLIVDHCFCVAGVHDSSTFPRIWDLQSAECEWVAVWDTGKTFGLNEDKLGFLISGSRDMQLLVDEALAVLQFGVARRQKLFFAQLLRRAFYYGIVGELRDVCCANVRIAQGACSGANVEVLPPEAGTLLLLDISEGHYTDEQARLRLLDAGVGVVAGSVFFHGDWKPLSFIRVALARQSEYFDQAFTRLLTVLK